MVLASEVILLRVLAKYLTYSAADLRLQPVGPAIALFPATIKYHPTLFTETVTGKEDQPDSKGLSLKDALKETVRPSCPTYVLESFAHAPPCFTGDIPLFTVRYPRNVQCF
jgi:hypothetical protein